MIELSHVSYAYHHEVSGMTLVLNDVSLSIPEGQFVCVLGHNGSGKSTLAKHLNALLLPEGGTVSVWGMDSRAEEKLWNIRQKVGMVFQNPDNQMVATVVEEDVAFGLENLGVPPAKIRERVDFALKRVGMYDYRNHAPHLLSGGQKQRVAIAGVLAMKPKCIVLDEPTAMLDPIGRREVMQALHTLNQEDGVTIIHITHFMEEAVQASRVVVMEGGKVILDDTPGNVFSQVELLQKTGLDVPQVTELAYKLNKHGIRLDGNILTVEQAIDTLLTLITKG